MKLLNIIRLSKSGRISASWLSSWRPDLQKPGVLIGSLLSGSRLVQGRLTRSRVIQTYWFCRCVARLYRSQGTKGVALFLKCSHVMLARALPGSIEKSSSRDIGKVAVAASRDGLPRVIPKEARVRIRQGHHPTIRLWFTLFGFYRILVYPGSLKAQTITDPGKPLREGFVQSWGAFTREFLRMLSAQGYKPLLDREPSQVLEASPLPITSVSANSLPAVPKLDMETESSYVSRFFSAKCWIGDVWGDYLWNYLWHLHPEMGTKAFYRVMEEDSRHLPECKGRSAGGKPINGRLSAKVEPAGKVRLFAMVDYWTQCALRPLHDWVLNALRPVAQDGTFNQVGPIKSLLKRIKDEQTIYSFDLSAATDRLPVSIQETLVESMFYSEFAMAWRELLVERTYYLPRKLQAPTRKGRWKGQDVQSYMAAWSKSVMKTPFATELLAQGAHVPYRYAVGQPMGAYSSWAMLAITHHCLIQFAARRANHTGWFRDYAVLGDDVVIADDGVARQYRILMAEVGVEIGLAKSLIARGGTLEFAKRLYFRRVDVSGLPWNLWSVAQQNLSTAVAMVSRLCEQGIKFTTASLSFAFGASWRAASRTGNAWDAMSKRLRILFVALTHPSTKTGVSRSSWLDWLLQKGPSLRVKVDTPISWFTPWGTALESEYLSDFSKKLEEYNKYFFPNLPTTSSVRNWAKEQALPSVHLLDAVWNRKVLRAQEALEKSRATIRRLISVNVSFQPQQLSAIFSQITSSVEKAMSAIPKVSGDLVFSREEKVRFPASSLFKLWVRWRERAGTPRLRPAGGIRPRLVVSEPEDRILTAEDRAYHPYFKDDANQGPNKPWTPPNRL